MVRVLALCAIVLLSACATGFHTTSVEPDAPAGTPVNGVPFRLSQPHVIKVFQKTQHGYVLAYETQENLPNQKQVYVLQLDQGLLSDAQIQIDLRQDGTLKVVETKAVEGRGDEALSALGDAMSDIEKAVTARTEAIKTAETQTTQKFESEFDNQETALGLKLQAGLLQAELDALPEGTAQHTRQEKRKNLLLVQFAANIAYQKLGHPSPFPGVSFP